MSTYEVQKAQLNTISQLLVNSTPVDTKSIDATVTDLQAEIDAVKADIRKERRVFLDSNVDVSPAVHGLYFTKVPDNKILIAFLSCFGAFLLFVGLLVIFNKIPLEYFQGLTMPNRLTTVGLFWCIALIFTYIAFFAFT
jgi:hypothetical protein